MTSRRTLEKASAIPVVDRADARASFKTTCKYVSRRGAQDEAMEAGGSSSRDGAVDAGKRPASAQTRKRRDIRAHPAYPVDGDLPVDIERGQHKWWTRTTAAAIKDLLGKDFGRRPPEPVRDESAVVHACTARFLEKRRRPVNLSHGGARPLDDADGAAATKVLQRSKSVPSVADTRGESPSSTVLGSPKTGSCFSKSEACVEQRKVGDPEAITALKDFLLQRFGSLTSAWKCCLDVKNKGRIHWGDFHEAMNHAAFPYELTRRCWRMFDADRSGWLVYRDYLNFFKRAPEVALKDMKRALVRKYGTIAVAWKYGFDPHCLGHCSFQGFCKVLTNVGVVGDCRLLWESLVDVQCGAITLSDLDREAADMLGSFHKCVLERWGTHVKFFQSMDTQNNGWCDLDAFHVACHRIKWEGDVHLLFRSLVPEPNRKYLTLTDIVPSKRDVGTDRRHLGMLLLERASNSSPRSPRQLPDDLIQAKVGSKPQLDLMWMHHRLSPTVPQDGLLAPPGTPKDEKIERTSFDVSEDSKTNCQTEHSSHCDNTCEDAGKDTSDDTRGFGILERSAKDNGAVKMQGKRKAAGFTNDSRCGGWRWKKYERQVRKLQERKHLRAERQKHLEFDPYKETYGSFKKLGEAKGANKGKPDFMLGGTALETLVAEGKAIPKQTVEVTPRAVDASIAQATFAPEEFELLRVISPRKQALGRFGHDVELPAWVLHMKRWLEARKNRCKRHRRGQPKETPLRHGVVLNRLKAAAYRYIVSGGLARLFSKIDPEGTGCISFDGFHQAVRQEFKVGVKEVTDADLEYLFRKLDKEGRGRIVYQDVVALATSGGKGPPGASELGLAPVPKKFISESETSRQGIFAAIKAEAVGSRAR